MWNTYSTSKQPREYVDPKLFFMILINFHSYNFHNKNNRKTYSATVSVKSIVNIIIKIGNAINFMWNIITSWKLFYGSLFAAAPVIASLGTLVGKVLKEEKKLILSSNSNNNHTITHHIENKERLFPSRGRRWWCTCHRTNKDTTPTNSSSSFVK